MEDKKKRRWISWQTRTLATYIAATVPIQKGEKNGLVESAQKIAMDDVEQKEMEQKSEAPVENKPGSYERLMLGMRGVQ